MNVIVFLLIAGAASARHVLDAQFYKHDINGGVVIDRRNSEYISQNPESTPYVNSDFRQIDKVIPIKTNQRLVQSTVTYNEQNHEESLNNISNEENDHRLRTNAYTTEAYSTTEYIVQDGNIYNSRKAQDYIANKSIANQFVITGQVYQRGTYNVGYIKSNEPKSRPENRPSINNNQDRKIPQTLIPIENSQNGRTNNISNHQKKPEGVLETVLIQPLPTKETREDIERLPKIDTDEQIWVWGTEETNATSSDPGSFDDRAAFTGDQCPTGQAKVKGICVDKD